MTLEDNPDGYTCFLNTYSASQTVSFARPVATPILLSCISTSAQESGVTPPATSSAGFTVSSGGENKNTSQVNATLLASIFTPGSTENQIFTTGLTTVISQHLGISNSSISVFISVDANGDPQLLLAFDTTSAPALCSFRGNISLAVTVGGTTLSVHIGFYSSVLSGWVLAKVDSLITLPLYISAPVGVSVIVFLLVSVCLFRTKFPNVKVIPLLSLLFSASGFVTNLLFIADLNNIRIAARDSPASMSTCSPATNSSSFLGLSATVMMSIAIVCLCVCSLIGWFSSARVLLRGWRHRSNLLCSSASGGLLSDQLSTKSYHFERWKENHKRTIYLVIFLCALSPKHMLILHSRLGGLQMFSCPYPEKILAYIHLWDLIPILVVYLPFTILQIVSTWLLSGWTPHVTAFVIVSCTQLLFSVAASTFNYCKNRCRCCLAASKIRQWCFLLFDMRSCFHIKVKTRKVLPSPIDLTSSLDSSRFISETDFGLNSGSTVSITNHELASSPSSRSLLSLPASTISRATDLLPLITARGANMFAIDANDLETEPPVRLIGTSPHTPLAADPNEAAHSATQLFHQQSGYFQTETDQGNEIISAIEKINEPSLSIASKTLVASTSALERNQQSAMTPTNIVTALLSNLPINKSHAPHVSDLDKPPKVK